MDRQQWGIALTGAGAMMLLTFFLMGGPNFSRSCTGSCDGFALDFVQFLLLGVSLAIVGVVLGVTGLVMLLADAASQRPPE